MSSPNDLNAKAQKHLDAMAPKEIEEIIRRALAEEGWHVRGGAEGAWVYQRRDGRFAVGLIVEESP